MTTLPVDYEVSVKSGYTFLALVLLLNNVVFS